MDQATSREFKSRFVAGVLSTTVGTFIPTVFSFVGLLLVLRWLDAADYGVYMLLMVVVQLVSTLSELGLRMSVVHHLQRETDPVRRRQMVNSALTVTLVVVACASLLTLGGRNLVFAVYDYELLRPLLWWFPALLLLTNLNNTAQGILQAEHLYTRLMAIRLMAAVVRLALMLLLVGLWPQGVWGLVYADVGAGALSLAAALGAIPTRKAWEWERAVVKRVMRFGFPLHMNQLLSFMFNRVDVMMIGNMTDAPSVAACEVAERVPTNLKSVVSTSFMTVFFPSVSSLLGRGETDKARGLVNLSLRVLSFGLMAIAVAVAMLQDEIVVLLFSDKYLEAGPAVTIFMLALALSMAGTVMGMTLVAAGHSNAPLRVNLVAVASNMIGNLILIPMMGFTGAALATFIMTAVTLPVNQWYLRRKLFGVDGIGYVLPVGIGLALVGLRHWAHVDAIGLRVGLAVAFAVVCPLILAPLRADLMKVHESAGAVMRARFGRAERGAKR